MISTLQDLLGELREVTVAKLLETCHSQSMCNDYLLEEGKLHGLWNVGLLRAEPQHSQMTVSLASRMVFDTEEMLDKCWVHERVGPTPIIIQDKCVGGNCLSYASAVTEKRAPNIPFVRRGWWARAPLLDMPNRYVWGGFWKPVPIFQSSDEDRICPGLSNTASDYLGRHRPSLPHFYFWQKDGNDLLLLLKYVYVSKVLGQPLKTSLLTPEHCLGASHQRVRRLSGMGFLSVKKTSPCDIPSEAFSSFTEDGGGGETTGVVEQVQRYRFRYLHDLSIFYTK